MTRDWKNVDRYPNKTAENGVLELYRKIVDLPSAENGSETVMSFNEEAQVLFDKWLESLELRLRSNEIQDQAFASHIGKYRSLVPSLALIFCICEELENTTTLDGEARVRSKHLNMAITWCRVLECHAATLYDQDEGASTEAAFLLHKIMAGKVPHHCSVRDLAVKGWKGLDKSDKLQAAAEELQSLGYLRVVRVSKGIPPLKYSFTLL